MERREYIKSRKYYLKGLSIQIRELKIEFKELERNKKDSYSKRREVQKAKYEFRHQHIAYCIARGRTYEQVEQKVRENNEPNQDYIRELLETYPVVSQVDNEKIVCTNS
jgi:predicted DNA binding CopG/RHH family protein